MIEDPEKKAWSKVFRMDVPEEFPEGLPAAWSTVAAEPPRVLHMGAPAQTTAAKSSGCDHAASKPQAANMFAPQKHQRIVHEPVEKIIEPPAGIVPKITPQRRWPDSNRLSTERIRSIARAIRGPLARVITTGTKVGWCKLKGST